MKLILILACLALYVLQTQAQQRCIGAPARSECTGVYDEGTGRFPNCGSNENREMAWYDPERNSCRALTYRGCGGNNNRHCSFTQCFKCRRPT